MFEFKPILNAMRRSIAGPLLLLLQIAITVAIVSNAASIIVERAQYLNQETGYPEDEIFHFTINTFGTDIDLSQQLERSEALLRQLPGVENAVVISQVPLSGSGSSSSFATHPNSQRDVEGRRNVRAAYLTGDENLVDTLGLTISEGRNFLPNEIIMSNEPTDPPSVAIVSRSFLEEVYPDGDGLGNVIYIGNDPAKIIGVIDKMKGPWLKDSRPDNVIFFPNVEARQYQNIAVRTRAEDRADVISKVEDALLEEYDQRVIINMSGMDESKDDYNASDLLMLRMLVVLICVLLLVTALGIFGLTVFNISKRTKQIGTRRALGATRANIIRYFIEENVLICAFGITVGVIAAFILGDFLLNTYELEALESSYVVLTSLFILVVSLVSVLLPANKAAKISPSIATRSI